MDDPVRAVADLVRRRNAIDAEIAAIIDRPPSPGHLGEWIAAEVLGVKLADSATNRAWDGHFTTPPELAGSTVNVKLYGKREGMLDIVEHDGPDYYLVLTGPLVAASTSRGQVRPMVIDAVYLFHTEELLAALRRRPVRIGVATSVRKELWEAAEIYPAEHHPLWRLSSAQRHQLELFASPA